MEAIIVQTTSGSYPISFGSQIWQEIIGVAKDYGQVLVVSDSNVAQLYGGRLPFPLLALCPGEEQKNLKTIELLVEDWARRGLDRQSLVIALGGGVIGDLVGFAASIYQRGIAYIQMPTTLLSQVDSSVGGKTGVNTSQGKNLVGSFHQPQGVFIDLSVLKSLPEREITNGLGEIFKYGLIAEPELFYTLQHNVERFYTFDLDFIGPILCRCCELKSEVVAADERDRGLRKILNFGHTLGHALEAATGYRCFRHGEAVLWGMDLEARLALNLGILSDNSFAIVNQGLQRVLEKVYRPRISFAALSAALAHDKKNSGGKIAFMLPRDLGDIVEVLLSPDDVRTQLTSLLGGVLDK